MTHSNRLHSLSLIALLVLAGCSVAPTYERPAVDVPAAYKESPAQNPSAQDAVPASQWKAAEPADDKARGLWWQAFGDATLNDLEERALAANQDLKGAAARLDQSRALQKNARAGLLPELDAGFGPTRQRPSAVSQGLPDGSSTQASTLWRAQLGVSYEADLFGRVSSTVDAAKFDAQSSEALFHSVQLALQADVAQSYFMIRELDAEQELYRRTVSLREQTLKLVQRRFDEGDIGELDLARARSEVASARSDLLGIERTRATAEHALAILLGMPPSDFDLKANPLTRLSVDVPAGLPSSLLERRPDIASAERAMAAANARVGAARAAFFPQLDITGGLGYEAGQLGNLFEWSSRTFLLGPLVGTMLSLPIFDGGRRDAGLALARAKYEEDVAAYRQTVLNAFREVEDNMGNLRVLSDQTRAQDEAVQASSRAAQLSQIQYREGSVSYLDVIDADRTVLLQQRLAMQLDGERARYTVNLIRAIGGDWAGGKPL